MATVEYRVRIRNAADSADALVVTSTRGGTNPYVSSVPSGDGASLDPATGKVTAGVFTLRIADPITSGTSRLFTSQLEDADFRQQLGQRKAYIEINVDSAGWELFHSGRLSRFELVTDIEWELAVSDWMQAEHEIKVFGRQRVGAELESIEDYLTRWPNRGCLIGGPVLNGFGEEGFGRIRPDLGGWQMLAVQGTSDDGYGITTFHFVIGYGAYSKFVPVKTIRGQGEGNRGLWGPINDACARYFRPGLGSTDDLGVGEAPVGYGTFPDLVVLINRNPALGVGTAVAGVEQNIIRLLDPKSSRADGLVVLDHLGNDGALNRVDVITADVSEDSPIYWTGHPVDLVAALLDEAEIPYDSASLETVRADIGSTARLSIRVTSAKQVGKFLEDNVYGPFGIGVRPSAPSTGVLEFFASNVFPNTTASLTIIQENDVEKGSTRPFALDTAKAFKTVALEHKRFFGSYERLDGVGVLEERIERGNALPGAIGTGELTYTLDSAQLHFARTNGVEMRSAAGWVDTKAHVIFDRRGRGGVAGRTTLLRGQSGDGVVLGQEIILDLPQVPNHNKRLGDDATVSGRAMQIVHITPLPKGWTVDLEDSGPNAQPVATIPTLSIGKAADNPRNVAEVTVTNAATLNALPAGLQLQWAVLASGATPAAADYTDVQLYDEGEIPTAAFRLPAVFADSKISVRARSLQAARRPSDWATVATVTIDALEPPTGLSLTATAGDGSYLDGEFTIGSGSEAAVTDVYFRLSSESSAEAKLYDTLLAGSDRFRIYGLTPSTEYTVSVLHRDPGNNDISSSDTETETTGGTTITMDPPTNPDGFSFVHAPRARVFGQTVDGHDGRYGIAVVAPVSIQVSGAQIQIAEAVETAVGAGTYGAYVTVDSVEPVSGDWTIWFRRAPTDGLKRKLKARAVRDGATSSAYCSEVTVDPSAADPLAIYPAVTLIVRATLQSTSATQVVVRVAVADPAPEASAADVTATYVGTGVGTISPASPETLPASGITNALDTTDFVDVTINRAAFGTGTGRVVFTAARAGRADGTDSVDVPALDSSGPSLTVTPTPGETSYSIVWSGTGTITVSIDGAAYATPSASPISVTRGTVDKTYAFKAVLDGQTLTNVVVVPRTYANASISISAPTFDAGANTLEVTWSGSNLPSGVKYNVSIFQNGSDGVVDSAEDVTSPHEFANVTGATGSGVIRVDGEKDGVIVISRSRAGTWPS